MKPDFQIPDFQIIGGGLIGLSTAYTLLKRGASVRIIEAREAVALETSFANAGMVHASLADPWNGSGVGRQMLGSLFGLNSPMTLHLRALPSMAGWGFKFLKNATPTRHWQATRANYKLAEYSMSLIHKWRDELDIKDGFESLGLLKIFRSQSALDKAGAITGKLQHLGLRAEYLTGADIANKEPCLASISDKLAGAIYYPDDYKADAYAFCKALEQAVIKLGGEIITGAPVKSVLSRAEKTIGVITATGEYFAGTTIIAAGAHSTDLLRPLGVHLPVRPVKGYSLTFENLGGSKPPSFPKLPVVDDDLHCAVTPLAGAVRIAGTAEITGFNAAMPKSRLMPLLNMLRSVYPDLAQNMSLEDGTTWHGFRPVSADGVPLIGMVKPGLALNTGHGHMGWTMSAGSGVLLADILLDRPQTLDPTQFSAIRN